ncbi:MAG: BrnA antitoxin family protein [Candidatus Sulfotelmatobacter sp.]
MKRTKAVKKRRKITRQKTISLNASAEEPQRRFSIPERMEWYKPIKKPVTLRLDADVIAWFKESGRGYQTRINRALRKMMKDEMKEEKKRSGE